MNLKLDNEKYTLYDDYFLEDLVVSKTVLKPLQCTNGHFHAETDEVYLFTSGEGVLLLKQQSGEEITKDKVDGGTLSLIPKGIFHQVFNKSATEPLVFMSIFKPYGLRQK